MKYIFLLLAIHTALFSGAQTLQNPSSASGNTDSLAIYNRLLTRNDMKKDLALFRDIRNTLNPGLYRYRTKTQIDSIYRWAGNMTKNPLRVIDFYKIILQLTDFEGSCHNYTEVDADLLAFLKRQKSYFPYALKYIDGQMLFNHTDGPIPLGSPILSINGIKDSTMMRSFYKYMTADGFTVTEKKSGSVNNSFGIRYLLEYGTNDSFVVNFRGKNSDTIGTVTIPSVTLPEREKIIATRYSMPVDNITDYHNQPSYSFYKADSNTAVLNLRIFNMAQGADDPALAVYVAFLDSVFNVLLKDKIQNLVMDIRGNPGGSDPTFEQPMMYLTDHPFKENLHAHTIFDNFPHEKYFFGISTASRMDEGDKAAGKQMLKEMFPQLLNGKNVQNPKLNPVYYPKQPAFKGQLYLLIDERVASAASHLASLVKGYSRNAIIVGVETCGGYYEHTGHVPTVYELPASKIKTKFSIVQVVQDAPLKPDQPEGRGIIPDHEVWQSYDDFISNRDGQMEFIKQLILKKSQAN